MAKVGRKWQSPIWDFFEYDSETDRSKCIVLEAGHKICGTVLRGKNPTNLKVHLRSSHRDANSEYLAKVASCSSTPGAIYIYTYSTHTSEHYQSVSHTHTLWLTHTRQSIIRAYLIMFNVKKTLVQACSVSISEKNGCFYQYPLLAPEHLLMLILLLLPCLLIFEFVHLEFFMFLHLMLPACGDFGWFGEYLNKCFKFVFVEFYNPILTGLFEPCTWQITQSIKN